MIGEIVGSYRILSKLSVGGMGTVYRAEHTLIGKLAAVKVLHSELSTSTDIVNRFFNEAKATTSIKHPGIVEVFDFGYMVSGHAYLIMEFLEGMSLARRLKTRGRTSEGEAAIMLRAVCSALAAAHAKGIVHRDLKPDNIFLVTDADSATGERPKILDFGIAKLTDIGLAGTVTKTGAVMGTPTYMSPEQCRGTGDVDHRADLYSLGCIFYELVAGRPPFTKLGAGELIGAHIYAEPEPPSKYRASITKETEQLIMALLDKRPERRPQSAKELAQRLSALAHQLGWITATSPDGITARALDELANSTPTVVGQDADDNGLRFVTTEPPDAPLTTTPYGDSSIQGIADLVEKPTTLSGAASQSVLDLKRSRWGVGLALLAVALLAGGAVAFVKFRDDAGERITPASTAATPAPASKPEIRPAAVEAKPATTPETKPETKPESTEKATPATANPEPETKPEIKPAKKPPRRSGPKPPKPPPKPDKPTCDNPPCIQDGV